MQKSVQQSQNTVILQDEGLRKLKGFVQIPKAVLLHKTISYGAKVAYGVVLGYAWQEEFCYPAQQALADDLACSVRQAQRFLDELRKSAFITWKQQGLNRPNIYFILPLPTDPGTGDVLKNKDTTNMSRPDTTNMSGQDTTNMSYKEYSSNNTHKTVNGSENPIHALPILEQPKEKTQYVADRILEKLGDAKSKKFYLLVASRIPEKAIKQNVAEILADGADDPAKLFTYRMMKYAEEQMATLQQSDAPLAAVQKQRSELENAMRM